jgi:hypothetical protein
MPESWADLFVTLDQSAVAVTVRESLWIYPLLETLHVIGIALVFGSILQFDLRVLGVSKALPLDVLGRHLLPWVWIGFALNAVTGILMFVSDAVEFSVNIALQIKLVLIVLAGLNALVFQMRFAPQSAAIGETTSDSPGAAKFSAALSITLWLAIVVAGRMMAYVK